jgi:hypothetical protein
MVGEYLDQSVMSHFMGEVDARGLLVLDGTASELGYLVGGVI